MRAIFHRRRVRWPVAIIAAVAAAYLASTIAERWELARMQKAAAAVGRHYLMCGTPIIVAGQKAATVTFVTVLVLVNAVLLLVYRYRHEPVSTVAE